VHSGQKKRLLTFWRKEWKKKEELVKVTGGTIANKKLSIKRKKVRRKRKKCLLGEVEELESEEGAGSKKNKTYPPTHTLEEI